MPCLPTSVKTQLRGARHARPLRPNENSIASLRTEALFLNLPVRTLKGGCKIIPGLLWRKKIQRQAAPNSKKNK